MNSSTDGRRTGHHWQRVTRSEPCAICSKPDWCARADGDLHRCMRGGEAPVGLRFIRESPDGGRLYGGAVGFAKPRTRVPRPPVGPHRGPSPAADWESRYRAGREELYADELDDFADNELGLSRTSVELLAPTILSGRYAWPERDETGRIIGLVRRDADGANRSAKGSRRGLTYQVPFPSDGRVLVVEGATDTAAATEAGFTAVGRPSASGGGDLLAGLLRGRDVVIIGENDRKPDGTWPGRDGAMRIAKRLAGPCASVGVAFPPEGVKDLREWLTGGGQ